MRTRRRYLSLALAVQFLLAAQTSPEDRTRHILDLWIAGKYDAIYAQWSEKMKGMPLRVYQEQSEQVKSAGKIQSIGTPRLDHLGKFSVVTIPLGFPSLALDFRVTWDEQGQIAGMWMTPASPPRAPWRTPSYVNPDQFTERDAIVGDDPWKLPGTIALPKGKGPFPGLVLVHGSGPNDRDESVGGAKVFKDLAQALASRGIAVLRYDKRTRIYPRQCAADQNFTMNQETVEDAVRAAALLRTQPEIDARRVFVLGHSQGGYMAPRVGKRDPKIAGLIVLAGNVRPLEELIREQSEYLGVPAPAKLPVPAAYLADLQGYNPAALARQLTIPMLILQGERDYQVTMKDFALWKAALAERSHVTFHTYPALNHLFIAGEGKSKPAEYERPGHVDVEVIQDIANWIAGAR